MKRETVEQFELGDLVKTYFDKELTEPCFCIICMKLYRSNFNLAYLAAYQLGNKNNIRADCFDYYCLTAKQLRRCLESEGEISADIENYIGEKLIWFGDDSFVQKI